MTSKLVSNSASNPLVKSPCESKQTDRPFSLSVSSFIDSFFIMWSLLIIRCFYYLEIAVNGLYISYVTYFHYSLNHRNVDRQFFSSINWAY